jgi:hypothetical protein
MESIRSERVNGLIKTGFYSTFESLKKKYSKELDKFTTRFRLTWRETPDGKVRNGRFSIKNFLSKFISLSNKKLTEGVFLLLIVVDETIKMPVDKQDITKLTLECAVLGEFMTLFGLYQVEIDSFLNNKTVIKKFIESVDWLMSTVNEKIKYRDKYFMQLGLNQFENKEHSETFIKFSKDLGMYSDRYSYFMHQCVIETKNAFRRTFDFLNSINVRDHPEVCVCNLCILCDKYLEKYGLN